MSEQIDLFADLYHSLEDLRQFVSELHWTGGINEDGSLQYFQYKLEFYKDLVFIVEFRDDTDNGEKIIDNCVELKHIGNGLYQIISIDGKALGQLTNDNPEIVSKAKCLIEYMEKGEVFKK